MAAYFIAKDKAIISAFDRRGIDPVVERFEIRELPDDFLNELRATSRKSDFGLSRELKPIVAAFAGSTIINQVTILSEFTTAIEALVPIAILSRTG